VDFLHTLVDFVRGILSGTYTLDMLIQWGGYILLVAIVFTETGLLVGLFLPGDSLLITAGLLAGAGKLNIWLINVLVIAAAIVGDSTGYAIGKRLGPRIFTRPKSLLFNPKHVARTQHFYEKYGAKTIVIARFVPIVRTFAPVLAGVGQMRYRRFLFYNVAGGIGWVASMTWAGYLLGQAVPNISKHMHVVVIVIIILSCVPIAVEIYRERRKTTTREPAKRR
jgi:membrane-associated protein